jgi:hypothetical protein
MFSVPPVKTTSASPSLISCAALMIVWKPEPQSLSTAGRRIVRVRRKGGEDGKEKEKPHLFVVKAGTSTGSPARCPT